MDDLNMVDRQFTIFCSFMLEPDSIIETIDAMRKSKDQKQIERADFIYKIIASYFQGKRNFREDMNTIEKGPKLRKVANIVESVLANENSEQMKLAKKKFQQLTDTNTDASKMIINNNEENPIEHSDLVFLNQLAAITASNYDEVSKLTQFNDRYYKRRLRGLYGKCPFYFEQAFCNTDIMIQDKILNILDTDEERNVRQHEPSKKKAFEFLEELYLVSAIDTKMLKSGAKFTKDKAFESFLRVLQNKEKSKTINILINDDSIMKAILNYKYNNKGSLSTLKHLFINTRYPFNRILLEKYTKLMKRSAENLRKDLVMLTADEKFAEAYNQFSQVEDIEILKENSQAYAEKLHEIKPTKEVLQNIGKMICAFMEYEDPIEEILSIEEMKEYLGKFFEYIVENELYNADEELSKTIDEYFVKCISNEFYILKSTERSRMKQNVISSTSPMDMWYEVNRVLYNIGDDKTAKVYLKYTNATYVFEPFNKLEVSDKMMMRADMVSLPDNEISIDVGFERIKSVDIYMHQIYQKITDKLFDLAIDIEVQEQTSKGFFKKATVESPDQLTEEEGAKIKKVIANYVAISLLVQKDKEIFLNRYMSVTPELLRDLYNLKKSFAVIKEKMTLTDKEFVIGLFDAGKNSMEQLHNDINKYRKNNFYKGVYTTMDTFVALAPLVNPTKVVESNLG